MYIFFNLEQLSFKKNLYFSKLLIFFFIIHRCRNQLIILIRFTDEIFRKWVFVQPSLITIDWASDGAGDWCQLLDDSKVNKCLYEKLQINFSDIWQSDDLLKKKIFIFLVELKGTVSVYIYIYIFFSIFDFSASFLLKLVKHFWLYKECWKVLRPTKNVYVLFWLGGRGVESGREVSSASLEREVIVLQFITLCKICKNIYFCKKF